MEQQILQTAYRLFTIQGIQQFTMDDISGRLGISKKTLYRFFTSRQELIERVCHCAGNNYETAMEQVDALGADSLQRLLGYAAAIVGFNKKISPVYISDLQKHYPLLWTDLYSNLQKSIHLRVKRVLENGIREGLFRGNLHPELVLAIWQQHMQKDFEFAAQLVNDYSKDEVFRQAMYLFLYGIIAPAAIPRLEEELNRYHSTINLPYMKKTGT